MTLGLSVEAIKSRLHRARAAVRQQLLPAHPAAPSAGCPDIVSLFSRHLEDDIDKDLCLRMEQHLGSSRGAQFRLSESF